MYGYSYWIAKLFGYELGPKGFVRNPTLWGKGESWAHAIASSSLFHDRGSSENTIVPKGSIHLRNAQEQRLQVLDSTWRASRELAREKPLIKPAPK